MKYTMRGPEPMEYEARLKIDMLLNVLYGMRYKNKSISDDTFRYVMSVLDNLSWPEKYKMAKYMTNVLRECRSEQEIYEQIERY